MLAVRHEFCGVRHVWGGLGFLNWSLPQRDLDFLHPAKPISTSMPKKKSWVLLEFSVVFYLDGSVN